MAGFTSGAEDVDEETDERQRRNPSQVSKEGCFFQRGPPRRERHDLGISDTTHPAET
jgi:hypothetical protein